MTMNILGVTSEMVPYAKTGGLADVMGALPRYLEQRGHDVRVFMPLYDRVDTAALTFESVIDDLPVKLGGHLFRTKVLRDANNPTAYFVHCPALYARGSIYTHSPDEHRRFLVLSNAALLASQRMGFAPDVLHCHDWQSAMLPLILKTQFKWDRLFAKTRTLLTIHNMNYQGGFSSDILPDLNLRGSEHLLHQDYLRQGRINFMLHGVLYADGVSTVSPTYAKEIQTPEHGAGMDPFLRARSSTVVGVLNGVDYEEWSPEKDKHIPHKYSADDLEGKELNKQALLKSMGLPYVKGVPLVGIVSRMASQKGFDLIPDVLPNLLAGRNMQLIVLGSGESRLESMFASLQRAFPKQVSFYRGFSNPLAHMIEAGADLFLMPSRYEPCGLNQMYSLRYGTVPVVHRTGGLADTVQNWNPYDRSGTGFVFNHHDAGGLRWALGSALKVYRDQDAWRQLMLNGMAKDYSWDNQARIYELLFERLSH
jgi:starch synthase